MRRLPSKYDPTGVTTHQSAEETNDPLIADHRNFYKVEKWTKDGTKVDHMLYAGSNLNKAREVFAEAIYHRPRIRLTIRQRTRVGRIAIGARQWRGAHPTPPSPDCKLMSACCVTAGQPFNVLLTTPEALALGNYA
jgi:hypothetical protein